MDIWKTQLMHAYVYVIFPDLPLYGVLGVKIRPWSDVPTPPPTNSYKYVYKITISADKHVFLYIFILTLWRRVSRSIHSFVFDSSFVVSSVNCKVKSFISVLFVLRSISKSSLSSAVWSKASFNLYHEHDGYIIHTNRQKCTVVSIRQIPGQQGRKKY